MSKLEFKAELFKINGLSNIQMETLRIRAQAFYDKHLEGLPKVFVRTGCCGKYHPDDEQNANSTHTARLEDIKDTEKC